MVGIYFSGTGNTKHCCELFAEQYDDLTQCYSIESVNSIKAAQNDDFIVFAYPVYFSNIPKIVRDFILTNRNIFLNKKVFIIATMGLFSGDGAGVSARLLKKFGAEIVGGLHLKMPDNIGDEKLLKKTLEKNKETVKLAEKKIKSSVEKLKNNTPSKEGLGIMAHIAGLFGQRLWFYNKTKNYSDKIKIDRKKCVKCGLCTEICPMKNLTVSNNRIIQLKKCTMCYRCVSNCPNKAITLLGRAVYEQPRSDKYLEK